MLTIRATFNIFGYQCREVDLTPAIGVSLLVGCFLLLVHTGL